MDSQSCKTFQSCSTATEGRGRDEAMKLASSFTPCLQPGSSGWEIPLLRGKGTEWLAQAAAATAGKEATPTFLERFQEKGFCHHLSL